MISRHVITAYKEDFGDGWYLLFRHARARLERLWAYHDQCPTCRGAGYTKATVHLMSMEAVSRMAADPVLAKQPVPICKTECARCQGAGVIYTGGI